MVAASVTCWCPGIDIFGCRQRLVIETKTIENEKERRRENKQKFHQKTTGNCLVCAEVITLLFI